MTLRHGIIIRNWRQDAAAATAISVTLSDIARLRLRSQQILSPAFKTPAGIVRWFSAVQSQDFAGSLYAIGARLPGSTEPLVEQALTDKTIVRTWPMRRTIHCVPAEDARWMVRLLAPRQNARMGSYYRKAGITKDDLERAGKAIRLALARGGQLTRPELYQAMNRAGIDTGAAAGAMRGLHLLVHWAQAGLICLASRRGKQHTFALLEEWTPPGRNLSGDEALAELATRYFRSHCPATVKDFAWWAGFTVAEAKQALRLIADSLESLTVEGMEYWLTRGARAIKPSQTNSVFLLPAFDEYTVGYADRSAAAEESDLAQISHGLAANIIIKGRIAGTWKRALFSDKVVVTYSLLRRLTYSEQTGLTRAVKEYARFIGKTAVISK